MKKVLLLAAAVLEPLRIAGAHAGDLSPSQAPQRYFLFPSSTSSVAGVRDADLSTRQAPPRYLPPAPPLWTGFYAGLNIGGGWSATSLNQSDYSLYTSPFDGTLYAMPGNAAGGRNAGGVVGGGQFGISFQVASMFVLGGEADFQGTSMSAGGSFGWAAYADPNNPSGLLLPLSPAANPNIGLNWIGTARGRGGFLIMPTLLVYGTAGFAYGGVTGGYSNYVNTRTGWTAGGGVEWMFVPNWSAKAEYLYADLNANGVTAVSMPLPDGNLYHTYGYHQHPQFNIVRAGVNYHFNLGSPVVAKY